MDTTSGIEVVAYLRLHIQAHPGRQVVLEADADPGRPLNRSLELKCILIRVRHTIVVLAVQDAGNRNLHLAKGRCIQEQIPLGPDRIGKAERNTHVMDGLPVLDIERIYKSRLAGFEKEDLVINCEDFGIEGIPCIKANIETDQYESYLTIVPGEFLAAIYKEYGPALLESNVRSFLKFNGGVNKGIRDTILNENSRFFTYNNGISTTANKIIYKLTDY